MVESKSQPTDSISTMTRAELETLIAAIVQNKLQQQNSYEMQIQQIKQKLAQPYDTTARSFREIVRENMAKVPAHEWEKVPKDASQRLDAYLYGVPDNQS
ncbi:hypothetical protein HJG54_27800 [Leptolyngbya sp. NK1-12]|uniref:Uncharacterized protein n=1 Tax=Leptolyngbya sp. NK1-12 TaxID=2547451 RepID=A0AA97AJ47_9CYAN|nr:hypothetical protein [Leptolyngbya sp. NK1-12]WNZ26249.1 hypothetical protein HJG54_27800 [Leptolyngbya sp. NK1-12]